METCTHGNPGMASGGMGDVLSGVIAGLLAQQYSIAESARLGVCIHSKAADMRLMTGVNAACWPPIFTHIRRLVNP